MFKKTDISDLDIPKDDIECWNKYPKHKWVYDLSRVLDAQNIKWNPFFTESMPYELTNISLYSKDSISISSSKIYVKKPEGIELITEVYIAKGEIRLIRHIDPISNENLPQLVGGIDIRINAFVTLYFSKFSGIISIKTFGNDIYGIQLRSHIDLLEEHNQDISKLVKKLYRKQDVSIINGLIQDRAIQETFTS